MTSSARHRDRQLCLPAIPDEHAWPSALLEHVRHQARVLDSGALIHLRCPRCVWTGSLRVPARRRRADQLDRLLPRVPVRHWVFSLGDTAQGHLVHAPRLRARVARACVAAVFGWLRRAAARIPIGPPVTCGAVSAIHRVGAALDANVHVHALVLDGVYTHRGDGAPFFHPVPAPRRRDLRRTVAQLKLAIDDLLARAPPRSGSTKARVVHRMTEGPVVEPSPGSIPRRSTESSGGAIQRSPIDSTSGTIPRRPAESSGGTIQRVGELDVRAGPPIDAEDRVVRARLCRYIAREPFDPSAVARGGKGRLRYRLAHPFADGTTHVEFSPSAMAERLGALMQGELRPPVSFHGVLAPGAAKPWLSVPARQLPLLDLAPNPPSPPSRTAAALQCPRCATAVEIVGVEPAPQRAA